MQKILILLFICYSTLFPQVYPDNLKGFVNDTTISVNIGEHLPSIKMNISINRLSPEDKSDIESLYNIKTFDSNKQKLIQEINDTLLYTRMYSEIKLIDINLDDYLDIAVVREITMHGNPIYNFWIYNPENNLFYYNSAYSELCCEMEIDTTNKEIFIGYYDSININSEQRYYKVYFDKPVLYELRETQSLKNIDSILIKEYGLENGKLKKIKEYKVKDELGWE